MSRITEPINDMNWKWFTDLNIDDISVTTDIVNVLKTISSIVGGLNPSNTVDSQAIKDVDDIINSIAGVSNGGMMSQEIWYNVWLSQSNPNYYSFSLNAIINIVRADKTTSNLNNLITQLNTIMKFVIIRHFAKPIPTSYLNNKAPVGTKPRLAENDSIYYTEMTDQLHSFFLNSQIGIYGIGNDTIKSMCANFSRTTISNYVPIKQWCGCFAPESPFTTEAKKLHPESSTYTVGCDPLCIYFDAIKAVDGPDSTSPGTNVGCNATLCIMSKFDLQTADSSGSINLSQNCPCSVGKASGPCICIIDSSIESLLNKMKAPDGGSMSDPVTFKQYCPGAECFVSDDKGNLTQTACQGDNPGETNKIHGKTKNLGTVIAPNIWLLFLSILLVGITLIQCARYIGHEPTYKIKGILEPKMKISKNTRSSDLGFLKK
tara:strand:- start:329 stop:1624 length:1296 start_codon:yes stop_codon:yes gene_type:complete